MENKADSPEASLWLVRLAAELPTKSRKVRLRFQKQLIANLRQALNSPEVRVYHDWDRIYIERAGKDCATVLKRVFGVSSFSRVEVTCRPELEEIVRCAGLHFREKVRGKRYAVRARRSGEHPFRSKDVEIALGAALNDVAEVNLNDPEITVHVEVRRHEVHAFCERQSGAGGLPLGVEGLAVSLMSGGFDSAVASWLMLKRGVAIDYVFCNLAGSAYERAVIGVVKLLCDSWSYGSRPRLHVIDFQELVTHMKQSIETKYGQVILKRLMYRAAEMVADQVRADAIVTGESIGQVSSQTLANLRAIDSAADRPVLRPLATMDKEEIIQLSRHVGTYVLSVPIQEYCAVVPQKPVTASTVKSAEREESKVDLGILKSAVSSRKVLRVDQLTDGDMMVPYLYTSEVPEDACVVDCRADYHYQAWHYPGAIHFEIEELLGEFRKLDAKKTYVLYCPLGLQSAVAAERMQRAGFEAYSFAGGSNAIREYAIEKGLDD